VLLRPGMLTREALEQACGQRVLLPHEAHGATPRASGTLESHYAPQARLRLMDANSLQAALDVLGADAPRIAVWARSPVRAGSPRVSVRRMPASAQEAARALFATLREFDGHGVQLIWVETPPDTPEWEGVADRLRRASAA